MTCTTDQHRRSRARSSRLSPEQIDELGREFDAIRDRVRADLGERDRRYIESMIEMHRRLAVISRVLLLASSNLPARVAGTAALSAAKILENMEIGHNVLHGQWDWMNDPHINSSTWDWDTASTAEAWKHSHNYVHHTFTNIRGKDKDLGYEIMRIDPEQKLAPGLPPAAALQPAADGASSSGAWPCTTSTTRRSARARSPRPRCKRQVKGIVGKAKSQIVKDYIAWPLLSGLATAAVELALESVADRREPGRRRRRGGLAGQPAARARQGRRRRYRNDGGGERDRQRRPQRLGLRDHLLRPLPRPDLHLQPRRGRGREPGRLVRAPALRRGQHRGRPVLPRRQRQPRLPGRAPPLPGPAEHPLRRDRAAGQRHLRALRPALQQRPLHAAAGDGAADDPAAGLPGRQAAAEAGAVPRRGAAVSVT